MGPGNSDADLEIVSTMVRSGVTGGKHVQRQTVKNWCGGYDGDVLDDVIDDLINQGLIREKGRGTITLSSMRAGKDYIRENDDGGNYTWYL